LARDMPHFVCITCGTRYAESDHQPTDSPSEVRPMQKHLVLILAVLLLTGCGTKPVPQAPVNDKPKHPPQAEVRITTWSSDKESLARKTPIMLTISWQYLPQPCEMDLGLNVPPKTTPM